MAHKQSSNSGSKIAGNKSSRDDLKLAGTVFHDFLGKGPAPDSSPAAGEIVRPPSPLASVSVGASSGGGCGPVSTTSDLGSDRQAGDHFEGVPFYGARSEFMGPEKTNVIVGMKRRNSNSYAATSADRFSAGRLDSIEGLELIKLLRSAGGDRPIRTHNEDSSFPLHLLRPTSASQASSVFRADGSGSRRDRCVPMSVCPTKQYPPLSGHVVPFGPRSLSNKLRDSNAGQLVTSSSAADEGSRTGIKGSGLFNSFHERDKKSDCHFTAVLGSSGKQHSAVQIAEPAASLAPSQRGLSSVGRQMTIFYGGQAHVFDSVHPNKADIIMALAGSSGESWSTTYTPNSNTRTSTVENCSSVSKNDAAMASNIAMQPEIQVKSFIRSNSAREFGTSDKMNTSTGAPHDAIIEKEAKASDQATDSSAEKNA